MKSECEGSCKEHKGKLRLVKVALYKPIDFNWGIFTYCENAIKEDKQRGFTVTDCDTLKKL